jgi:hypothetical protein
MVVCVCPKNGFYFRINSNPWPVAVELVHIPNHPFLKRDSYLECNGPVDLDDYTVEESIKAKGIIGRIDAGCAPEIVAAVKKQGRISDADKEIIFAALAPYLSK